jgi:hypothetical protein
VNDDQARPCITFRPRRVQCLRPAIHALLCQRYTGHHGICIATFVFDVVNTCARSDLLRSTPKSQCFTCDMGRYSSSSIIIIEGVVRQSYHKEGTNDFFHGLGPIVIRWSIVSVISVTCCALSKVFLLTHFTSARQTYAMYEAVRYSWRRTKPTRVLGLQLIAILPEKGAHVPHKASQRLRASLNLTYLDSSCEWVAYRRTCEFDHPPFGRWIAAYSAPLKMCESTCRFTLTTLRPITARDNHRL